MHRSKRNRKVHSRAFHEVSLDIFTSLLNSYCYTLPPGQQFFGASPITYRTFGSLTPQLRIVFVQLFIKNSNVCNTSK